MPSLPARRDQPYAELIPSTYSGQALRGSKTDFGELSRVAELRSILTTIVGERFYIYACKKKWPVASGQWPVKAWSDNLRVGTPPLWMIELAEQVKLIEPDFDKPSRAVVMLPTGVIVGSAVIERVTPPDPGDAGALFRWHLADVKRAKKFRKPKGHPQPVSFEPF